MTAFAGIMRPAPRPSFSEVMPAKAAQTTGNFAGISKKLS